MMQNPDSEKCIETQATVSSEPHVDLKRSLDGIILIPQPTDDPLDPLDWPQWKKLMTLIVVSIASSTGYAQATANQSGYFQQAAVYGKTATEISYGGSAAVVGLATGPLLWATLALKIGRSSCILWGMVGCLACDIWAALMTERSNYTAFVISRWLGCTFGCVAATLGGGTIIDIYFLHQRGKAFNFFFILTLLGIYAGPTFSGFIVASAPWPVQYWWTVGAGCATVVLIFLFLEETGFNRDGKSSFPRQPPSWLANRLANFFPGHKVVPHLSSTEFTRRITSMFLISVCPVTVLAGGFLSIAFGFTVGTSIVLSIFLESPKSQGGYNFTPSQYAAFNINTWISCVAAQIFGYFMNDRLPVWIANRREGIWEPEYRLYSLWVPAGLILPIGFGVFGASLEYHLHYMVLALASFLIFLAGTALVPIVVNYVVECFPEHAVEANTIMAFYRVIFGLFIPFFITEWEAEVGVGWVFGMMAFFSLMAFGFTFVLMWKGRAFRSLSFKSLGVSEAGKSLINKSLSNEAEIPR